MYISKDLALDPFRDLVDLLFEKFKAREEYCIRDSSASQRDTESYSGNLND